MTFDSWWKRRKSELTHLTTEEIARVAWERATLHEKTECAQACQALAAQYGGVTAGRFTSDFGKEIFKAMAAGAANAAKAIRARSP